jgi:ankyrin repeat protein
MEFLPTEPKRKSVTGQPDRPPLKKTKTDVTREEAFAAIRADWQIVKTNGQQHLKRKKDRKYEKFLKDKGFVLSIVGMNAHILRYIDIEQFRDAANTNEAAVDGRKEIVLDAVCAMNEDKYRQISMHPSAMQWAPEDLKRDVGLVKEIRGHLVEFMQTRDIETFDKLIPDDILLQIPEACQSIHFLKKSIKEGNYQMFETLQLMIPKKKEAFLRYFLECFSTESSLLHFANKLPGYKKIFVWLTATDNGGLTSLKRLIKKNPTVNSDTFRMHLSEWLTGSAGNTIVQSLLPYLRPSGDEHDITTDMTKAIAYKLGKTIDQDELERLSQLLMDITYGQQRQIVSVYRRVIEDIAKFSTTGSIAMFDDSLYGQPLFHHHIDPLISKLLVDLLRETYLNTVTENKLFEACIRKSYLESAEILRLSDGDVNYQTTSGASLLLVAVQNANLETIRYLCNHGADVEGNRTPSQRTPLMLAQTIEVVKCLLDFPQNIDKMDNRGYTTLHLAVENGNINIVKELLRRGADANIPNIFGRTAAFKAVNNLDVAACREIFNPSQNVDINHKDVANWNTVMHCLAKSSSDVIEKLNTIFQLIMARGPDLSILDKEDRTPLVGCRNNTVRTLLIDAGAGGKFVTDKFRKLDALDLAKPDPEDPDELISCSSVQLLTQGDVITMETSTWGPARCLPCKHVIGTPELHSWLNQNDADIEQNMDPDAGGLLGLPPRFKNECPTCRETILFVEILSSSQAENWDYYEGEALKEEEKIKVQLGDFKGRAEYKQYVSNVSSAKAALKAAREKLEEEEHNLQEEDRKGSRMWDASDKIQREYRDKRLFGRPSLLDLF